MSARRGRPDNEQHWSDHCFVLAGLMAVVGVVLLPFDGDQAAVFFVSSVVTLLVGFALDVAR